MSRNQLASTGLTLVFVCLATTTGALAQHQDEAQAKRLNIIINPTEPLDGTATGPQPINETPEGPVQGWRALTATSSTKTQTPIEEIPGAIQVIPKEVIVDLKPISVDDVLRSVSNVQGNNRLGTPTFDSTTVRGLSGETWIDGLVNYYNAGDREGLVNVERIEVLKGSTTLLYGGGAGMPEGGAVNIISKLPEARQFGEVGATVGSYGYLRPYFDINQPLGGADTVLFRLTGEYVSSEDAIDAVETQRYSLNPTLTIRATDATALTLQVRVTDWTQPEYQGLPATGTVAGDFDIDRDLFIGDEDIRESYSRSQSLTATLDHAFSEIWSAKLVGRVGHAEFSEEVVTIAGADGFAGNTPFVDPSTWGLYNANLYQELNEQTFTATVTGKFESGPVETTIVLGGDWSRVTDDGFLNFAFAGFTDLAVSDPAFPDYVLPTSGGTQDNEYTTSGLYAQAQVDIWDRLHLLLGGRLAAIEIETNSGGSERSDETRLLPRIGAAIDILEGVTVYASYGETIRGVPNTYYAESPKPIESSTAEAGVKLVLPGGLAATFAAFEMERSNVPVGFPAVPEGEESSRGFEVDLSWQPTETLRVLASYGYTDAEYTQTTASTVDGNDLVGVPLNSGSFALDYRLDVFGLPEFRVGGDIYYAGDQAVDAANVYETDEYTIVGARLSYDDKRFFAALNVENLFDEEYFRPYSYFGGRVAPGESRTIYLTAGVKY